MSNSGKSRILVAMECSGNTRNAFRNLGYEAYSCDILPSADNSPYHYQCDIFELLKKDMDWALMIAHPVCRFLTNSGSRWLWKDEQDWNSGEWFVVKDKNRWKEMEGAALFFRKLWDMPIPRICIENPVPHKYALKEIGVKYTQIINPWEYGHLESKKTCLWLKNLPKLIPTNNVKKEMDKLPKKQTHKVHYMSPGKDRSMLRSITPEGFSKAFAEQWGPLL